MAAEKAHEKRVNVLRGRLSDETPKLEFVNDPYRWANLLEREFKMTYSQVKFKEASRIIISLLPPEAALVFEAKETDWNNRAARGWPGDDATDVGHQLAAILAAWRSLGAGQRDFTRRAGESPMLAFGPAMLFVNAKSYESGQAPANWEHVRADVINCLKLPPLLAESLATKDTLDEARRYIATSRIANALAAEELQAEQENEKVLAAKTARRANAKERRTCYRCGNRGHIAQNCRAGTNAAPPPKQQNSKGRFYCIRCRSTEHTARNCAVPMDQILAARDSAQPEQNERPTVDY